MGVGCLGSLAGWALISLGHPKSSAVRPQPPPPPPLVLLDRDGVINEDVGPPGVLSISQLVLTPDAGDAIGRLKRKFQQEDGSSAVVVMVTNQSSVGKGLLSHDGLDQIQQKLQELLWDQDDQATLDKIYQCTSDDPHHPRRKPQPGMVKEALHQRRGESSDDGSTTTTSPVDSECDG